MKGSRKWATVEKKAGLGPQESKALLNLIKEEDAGLLDRLTAHDLKVVVILMRRQKGYGMDEMYKELTSK
ncbi:MAG: hypothetical protein IJF90_06210 [Synergistaceae bacterium]|nr:hypothetical protein [Synergistaceae bacterium]